MKRYLIAYDIPHDKRRTKISNLLSSYGIRVNYSLFELHINDIKFNELINKLKEEANMKKDNIRIYHICLDCIAKSFTLTNQQDPFMLEEKFI